MSPTSGGFDFRRAGLPRTRGDEPQKLSTEEMNQLSAPHPRG